MIWKPIKNGGDIPWSGLFWKQEIVKNKHIYELKIFTAFCTLDVHYINSNDVGEQYHNSSCVVYENSNELFKLVKNKDMFGKCLTYTKKLLKNNGMYGQHYCHLPGISIVIIVGQIINKYDPNTIINL